MRRLIQNESAGEKAYKRDIEVSSARGMESLSGYIR
jgi:hypothetical protein